MTGAAAAVNEFIDYIQQVRQLSPHTVAAYRRDLKKLLDGIGDKAPAEVTAADLQRLLAAARRAEPATLARQLAAWRAFYKYLVAGGLVKANPVDAVPPPKRRAHLPKALSPDEMTALLKAVPKEEATWLTVRDQAIMELFYSAALRLSELTRLNIDDIDLSSGYVYVQRGKGGRGRTAPLGTAARQALKDWLAQRRQLLGATAQPALFIGRNLKRLGERAVQKRIAQHVEKNAFPQSVSPHTFRHSCASHFLQSSQDLRATQELLGHKDIAATQIYTRLDFQHLAAIYDTAHPRAKKRS